MLDAMFAEPDRAPRPDTRNLKRIDQFVRRNRFELAALVWGYTEQLQAQNVPIEYLGIDLQPQPRFITCSRSQLETLNQQVDNRLREAIGVLDGYDPAKEVLMVGIADGQVQLIVFASEDPTPAECFTQVNADVETLLDRLEARMQAELTTD